MRCIVTGGAGFIGSNLANTLAPAPRRRHHRQPRYRAAGEHRAPSGPSPGDVHQGGITDLDLFMETFPGADGIFHQAAIPSVPRSVKDLLASNEANVTGTLDVLVAAKDCGVPAIAY